MKKVLSLVLVMAMVLSSMSFAFASTSFEDIADTDYAEAINALVALGIVTGYEDGTYRPEKTVTRAEMAKLLVEISGFGDLVAGSKSNFSDTQGHWADSWIALAAGKNIVIGTGDGKFTPDRAVSYDEAITMIVRALGYTDSCNEIKNMTWPTNFKVKAAELGLTDDVTMSATGADRGGVAQLLFNALEATLVTINTDGDVVKNMKNGEEIQLLSRIADLKEDYEITEDKVDPANKNFAGELIDLKPYMFQFLEVYLNDDDQVVYIKDNNSLVVEGEVDDVVVASDDKSATLTVDPATGNDVDIDFDLDDGPFKTDNGKNIGKNLVFKNGTLNSDKIALEDLKDAESIKVVANDEDGNNNGKIEENEIRGFVVEQRTDVVRVEDEYEEGDDSLDGIYLPLNDDDDVDFDNLTVTGDATSLEDIQEDDIVVAYADKDGDDVTTLKLVVSRDTVEGRVTRIDGDTYYIDGEDYDLGSMPVDDNFALGDEGVFYLDHKGEIVAYDGDSAGPTDYAVVLGLKVGTTESDFGDVSVDDYPQIKLATQNGEAVVYDVETDVEKDGNNVVVDKPAKYTDKTPLLDTEKVTGKDYYNIVFKGEIVADENNDNKNDNILVKYKLNSDNRITKIELVQNLDDNAYPDSKLDLDKSTNEFVSNAVIFDAGDDDFDTVDVDDLPSDVIAFVVRNSNGDIEVLVAADGQVKSAKEVTYAYIYDVNPTYADDDTDEEVQYALLYTKGIDTEIKTTDSDTVIGAEGVFALDYDGELIDTATKVYMPTTATGIKALDEDGKLLTGSDKAYGYVMRGQPLDRSKKGLEMSPNQWYQMSEDAVVVKMDKENEADDVSKLSNVKYGENANEVVVYLNSDKEIDLILIMPSK
nr:S-layer homology domain-containing protein [Sedimentibacter sp.]